MSTLVDTENRFKALASRGDKQRGLDLLKKLQKHYDDGKPS